VEWLKVEALSSNLSTEKKFSCLSLVQWLMPVIPATYEAEKGRIMVRSQPWANSSQETPSQLGVMVYVDHTSSMEKPR
jgi:hypothetical protein